MSFQTSITSSRMQATIEKKHESRRNINNPRNTDILQSIEVILSEMLKLLLKSLVSS